MKNVLTITLAFFCFFFHSFAQRSFGASEELSIATPPSVPVTAGIDTVITNWTARTVVNGLLWPWDLELGKDDTLYYTEKAGRIGRIGKNGGTAQVLLDIRTNVYKSSYNTTPGSESISQDGMLGFALHPNFNGNLPGGVDSIYVAYTVNNAAIPYAHKKIRISRFKFNGGASPSLSGETIIIQGIPAGADHSSGRLIFGPDGYLYYSCGDDGNNQFNNKCLAILSQNIPTAAEISARNYANYAGKILRISSFDSTVPATNPTINGVKSHVWSYGHRNPQGLAFEKNPVTTIASTFATLKTNGRLFDAEQMVRTDDEINIIDTAKNYGWPFTQGFVGDDNYRYVNWVSSGSCASVTYSDNPATAPAGASVYHENSAIPVNGVTYTNGTKNSVAFPSGYSQLNLPPGSKGYADPIATLFTYCGTIPASSCDSTTATNNYLQYPTVATSSIEHYSYNNHIPGWQNSLLVTALKRGRVYMMNIDSVLAGSLTYRPRSVFATNNRYRDIVIDPDGVTFYLITDRAGATSGPTSGGTSGAIRNPGSILRFRFTGGLVALGTDPNFQVAPNMVNRIYPNPASDYVNVETKSDLRKPCRYVLTDMAGRIALTGSSSKDNFQIPVRNLIPGIYILKIFNQYGADVKTEKILVQH
jgi:PQQ-dependent dehydrogenase (s-GDH family)